MPNPEFERETRYIGGPWDGQTRWEPKAFWPPTNQMPSGERGLTGAWPDAWPADEPRYMPEIVHGESGCQVRYVWAKLTLARPDRDPASRVAQGLQRLRRGLTQPTAQPTAIERTLLMSAAMDRIRREAMDRYGAAPETAEEALAHVLKVHEDEPDDTLMVEATNAIYGQGVRTGLTMGDLRALADTDAARERARKVAREMFAGLMPGATGTNMAAEVADRILAAVRNAA